MVLIDFAQFINAAHNVLVVTAQFGGGAAGYHC